MTRAGFSAGTFPRAQRYPGMVALLCTPEAVYLSRGFSLWKMTASDQQPRCLSTLPASWGWRHAARCRHLRRLGRLDLRELIQLPDGWLLASVGKAVTRIHPQTGSPRQVFRIHDGGRPKGFALTPSGHLFVGEYWHNRRRRPLRIWGSADDGRTWELAFQLAAGSAQHIHSLLWDPHRQGLWVLTGDADGECALLFTTDEFQTVSEVIRGDQRVRACHLFCRPEGLYYGTDTERALNWFIFFDPASGRLQQLQQLPGSTINAARMAGRYFLSTSVEPSKINRYRRTVLFTSADLRHWTPVADFEKDCCPGYAFGFGSIILPRVQGECSSLVFSPVAVKGYDYNTFFIPQDRLK